MKRSHIFAGVVVIVVAGALAASGARGDQVDCLAEKYLGQGGLHLVAELPADAGGLARAQSVAHAEFPTGDSKQVKFGLLQGQPEVSDKAPVYLVAVYVEDVPHPLPAGPADAPPIMVTSPCSVVAVSEDGSYLFTYRYQQPVEP
ncbi:MAG TPA: hypothetical protein VFN14_07980 [Candidatus Limnocylindria bacterium]|nr:hypothetical protein [Candidatus Limnocylindria bacterium]